MSYAKDWSSWDRTRFKDDVTDLARELSRLDIPGDVIGEVLAKYVDVIAGGNSAEEPRVKPVAQGTLKSEIERSSDATVEDFLRSIFRII